MHATTAFLAYEHGLVLFQRQISILLDCFCIGSMAMPRVWLIYFWAGLCTSFFLSVFFFVGPLWPLLYTTCILPLFLVDIRLFIDQEKKYPLHVNKLTGME